MKTPETSNEVRTRRRVRDPVATRATILEASANLLAKDGPEGVSLSAVAHLAGVNRGTAYQHFETRERLIEATLQWVSDRMFRAVFGDPATLGERRIEEIDQLGMVERLCNFAMGNPDLCRVWLQQVLTSPDPRQDPFWREYFGSFLRFSRTEMAEPDMDVEILTVVNLAGVIFWPILARAHAVTPKQRTELSRRFSQEILRLSLFGTMRADAFPDIVQRIRTSQNTEQDG